MLALIGCSQDNPEVLGETTPINIINKPTSTAAHHKPMAPTPAPSTPTIPMPAPTITITATLEPIGCLRPSDDYTRIAVNGHQLNRRTYKMLVMAQAYYGGEIDLPGDAITQGSYTNSVEASFGTHAGGGAVDLSVMAPGTFTILHSDIPSIIKALRLAGFAAWYRDFDALYDDSPPHIHAIAIGDRELSMPAREQLAGPHGYFWGYDGLPVEQGLPTRDPHGGPVMCQWMIDLGYPNKTTTPSPEEVTLQP
jgi:hypothetical protein